MSMDLDEGTITFYRLWDYMRRAGIKKQALTQVFSPTTINKLDKDDLVTTATIAKLCAFLNCKPEEIMEYDPNKKASAQEERRKAEEEARKAKREKKQAAD